ncbi:MAG: hypothetical protein GY816_23005 [Cytophagales bacterium]|nr:hypothetical protein [Cytophagales bacterium]
MEGATIRSEQGIATALYLVSWIDTLLHHENFKQSTSGKLPKESLTIPSIIRQLQYENLLALLERVKCEEEYVQKWLEVTRENINRKRRKRYELVSLNDDNAHQEKPANARQGQMADTTPRKLAIRQQYLCQYSFFKNYFRKLNVATRDELTKFFSW